MPFGVKKSRSKNLKSFYFYICRNAFVQSVECSSTTTVGLRITTTGIATFIYIYIYKMYALSFLGHWGWWAITFGWLPLRARKRALLMQLLNSFTSGLIHLIWIWWFMSQVTMSGEFARPPGMLDKARWSISMSFNKPGGFILNFGKYLRIRLYASKYFFLQISTSSLFP